MPRMAGACDVAEVELDRDTWEVRPWRLTVVTDVGKAIHPALATGQIEGHRAGHRVCAAGACQCGMDSWRMPS